MNASEFIAKWRRVELRERQACQEHFLDLCELLGHPKPAAADPTGERFCFDRGAKKLGGEDGWADVWKKGFFGWEYKGKRRDLLAAYKQLNDYRENLGNPSLLVVCDMGHIEVHTNFTNTDSQVYDLSLDALGTPEGMRKLRAVFFDPDSLRPTRQRIEITKDVAKKVGELAQALRSRDIEPHAAARFLDRLVFCMFAEDVGLLRKGLFSEVLAAARQDPKRLRSMLEDLFGKMATGGFFGADPVKHFNGNLFDDATVIDLLPNEIALLDAAAKSDWGEVEPAIFGSLFERGLDPDKRSQIGAHYTSREDIETLVEPLVMEPLRREWEETRTLVLNVLSTGKKRPTGVFRGRFAKDKAALEAAILIRDFLDHLTVVRVLDPACGSGNFLYVTLQRLMDLEREVISFADAHSIGGHFPRIDPRQLYGVEINAYAFELAQMTVWIGYLQWMSQHGVPWPADPVLKRLATIQCRDAILDLSDPEDPKEPEWPAVDFIVSNPPFLGNKLMRGRLGDDYVNRLRTFYKGRVPGGADLCCYWFEKARKHIEDKKCRRAGLLGTQGIRGGANRKVLESIKKSGDIFFAVSDREWILDGANVHVSMVGQDDGSEQTRTLDGASVTRINSNLTTHVDTTKALRLHENRGLCYQGPVKVGGFEVPEGVAREWLLAPNPRRRPNSDVLVLWVNGQDITSRPKRYWIIDFESRGIEAASSYEAPFSHVEAKVKPLRVNNKDRQRREYWWRLGRSGSDWKAASSRLTRAVFTPRVAKHRLFEWVPGATLPDSAVVAFAREDDYFFGVLHSRVHEVWARRQGTQLRERESGFRYTPTTCFETFPFPWPPGREPQRDPRVQVIAQAAKDLDDQRSNCLNPPEWVREEVLGFPGSVDGPWARYVHEPDSRGIGTVQYPRVGPKDTECAVRLEACTLTNLYNERPMWLTFAHEKLDAAVFAAYDWNPSMSDDQILGALLALNLDRAQRAMRAG